ncbi:RNAPII degradation factor, partial [Coemansia sp. RSA 2531]
QQQQQAPSPPIQIYSSSSESYYYINGVNMSAAPPNTYQAVHSSSRGDNKVSRGGSNSRAPSSSVDEAAEFKILRNKHLNSLRILNEMYPDWTDADLLSAIEEANGDLTTTIDHITDGK